MPPRNSYIITLNSWRLYEALLELKMDANLFAALARTLRERQLLNTP